MNLDFSSFFNPGSAPLAGKFMGLSGFEPGFKLDNLVTGKPNTNQMVLDTRRPDPSQTLLDTSRSSGSSFEDTLAEMIRRQADPDYRKQVIADKLAYDKEQMKQAFPYLMAREIPRLISDSFARTADITRETGYAVPRAYADTFRALSRGPY